MPYRAVFITLITVTLALLAAGMWMRAISPLLVEVNASTQAATRPGTTQSHVASTPSQTTSPSTTAATEPERPDRQFKDLVKAVMFATFLIVVLLFVLCLLATMRVWMRAPARPKRTRYVDAWKIAGERLPTPGGEEKDNPAKE